MLASFEDDRTRGCGPSFSLWHGCVIAMESRFKEKLPRRARVLQN
jgi:hypothetical protein